MVPKKGADYARIRALMGTAMSIRGMAGGVIDGGVRDTPQIRRMRFLCSDGALDDDQSRLLRGRKHSGHVRKGTRGC
jgi:hypothetical protein